MEEAVMATDAAVKAVAAKAWVVQAGAVKAEAVKAGATHRSHRMHMRAPTG